MRVFNQVMILRIIILVKLNIKKDLLRSLELGGKRFVIIIRMIIKIN